LNPANPSGRAELLTVSRGYSGLSGIDAVKAYLTDIFVRATGNLDINVADAQGGRKDSWAKCIGLTVATATTTSITGSPSAFTLGGSSAQLPGVPTAFAATLGTVQTFLTVNAYPIILNWGVPTSNGGSQITGYEIEVDDSSLGAYTLTGTTEGGVRTYTFAPHLPIPGDPNQTRGIFFRQGSLSHACRVRAKNSYGHGLWATTTINIA
jgi:hypothetical protein